MLQRILGVLLVGALFACATSPLGRRQLRLFPDAEMSQMGIAAYDKMKEEMPRSQDARTNAYVRCVADAVTAELQGRYAGASWEVDALGLDLMARAGFDPRESIQLWKNMSATGGAQPPEFLSTHPSHGTRIQDLNARMPNALTLWEQARSRGRRPACS